MRNILFITADQLRWDALGFEGVFPVRTPNIDRLARHGTVFENAYCSNPLCVPARASIMTGRYCADTGIYYNSREWDERLATIPGELGANGYYSVAVGKMHFRPRRANRGFAKRTADNSLDYPGYLRRKGYKVRQKKRRGDGSIHNDEAIWDEYTHQASELPVEDYVTGYTVDKALHELDLIGDRRECTPGGNEPFFMWLSFIKPHTPCDPPEPYFSMYDPDDLPPPVRNEQERAAFPKTKKRFENNWKVLTDDVIRKLRAQYLGNVTLIDDQLGRVFDKLDEMGIADNTLIIFSSDHGDHLGDHHLQQKGFFYDCSARVPLIFYGPDIPAGKVIRENVSHIDLLPTLLDYCQLTQPKVHDPAGDLIYRYADFGDAVSLMPAFREGEQLDPDRVVVSESGVHGQQIMLKQGSMKYNYYPGNGEIERFDLVEDPDELHDTGKGLTLEALPDKVREKLQEMLRRTRRYHGTWYTHGDRLYKMFE